MNEWRLYRRTDERKEGTKDELTDDDEITSS